MRFCKSRKQKCCSRSGRALLVSNNVLTGNFLTVLNVIIKLYEFQSRASANNFYYC